MNSRGGTRLAATLVFCLIAAILALPGISLAEEDPAVAAGVQYLKSRAGGRRAGESAMIALALLKAEVPQTDPVVQACIEKVKTRFTSSSYSPELGTGVGTYEAAATMMALANLDATENRSLLDSVARFIKSQQNANGSWDYRTRTQGDTSISQYAVLALWEAENAGVPVSPSIWDRAAAWFLSVQSSVGSWNYHRDEGSMWPDTLAMTAAGVGSLMICQRQLERYRHNKRDISPLLTALVGEPTQELYRPSTTSALFDQAIKRGAAWIGAHFFPDTPARSQSPYYALYGIERIGALGDRQTIGKVDWFVKGRDFIHGTHNANGSWTGTHGIEMNTVWAILFLTRSTAKTIRRITLAPKLGAGTLLGGRELPRDLTSMTVAGGRVVSRPMNGAIEQMLAVLEDPRAEQADTAVAGLVDRYYTQGAGVLRPFKPRFRKMLSDRDPGVRRVAAWALAHTGDLDVVPLLIDAMVVPHEDEDVITSIRMGLQILSRKIQGLGPPTPSSPEERRAAAQKWREWYQAIRPIDLEGQDDDIVPSGGPAAAATSPKPSEGQPK